MTLTSPQIIQQGNSYKVQHGTDAGLFVQFYMESLKDEEQSAEKGRPIYIDREFIKIIPVGDKNTVVCRPVRKTWEGDVPPDNERWPQQYAAFTNQQTQVTEGTPLEQWPPLSKSQVMTLKSVNVHTVEQLSVVSDTNLQNLGMGARDLRDKALAYLKDADSGSGLAEAQETIKKLTMEIEGLKNQMSGFKTNTKKKKDE
jgi:hypothetical protein